MTVTPTAGNGVVVVIHDAALDRMHQRGGMIHTWWKGEADQVRDRAKGRVFSRTYRLKNSIRSEGLNAGRRAVVYRVRATAPYAAAVHEGTLAAGAAGKIRAKDDPPGMWIPVREGSAARMWWRGPVRGQRPNPFLTDGMNIALVGRGLRRQALGRGRGR